MAVSHIDFNRGTVHGAQMRQVIDNLERAYEGLDDLFLMMERMIDGNGSDAAHFTYMQDKFGFSSNAVAKAAFEELASLRGKLRTTGDGVTTTHVKDAIEQVFSKFR